MWPFLFLFQLKWKCFHLGFTLDDNNNTVWSAWINFHADLCSAYSLVWIFEFLSAKGVKWNQNLSKILRVFYVHNFNWPPYKISCDGRQWSHPSAVNLLLLSSCFMENFYWFSSVGSHRLIVKLISWIINVCICVLFCASMYISLLQK